MNTLLRLLSYALCISLWFFAGCSGGDEPKSFDCSTSDLSPALDDTQNASSCTATDGAIEVSASGGEAPYEFKLDGGSFQETGLFNANVSGGSHIVTVRDNRNCEALIDAVVGVTGSTLLATKVEEDDTQCNGNNGTVTITVTGGAPPYDVTLNTTTLTTNPATFSNLAPGTYDIVVTDADNCEFSVRANVGQGLTGIDYINDIKPIFIAKCQFSGCHPDNGDWFTYSTAKNNAALIKTKTGNGDMPKNNGDGKGGDLSAEQIALIACWVDDGAPQN